MMSIDEILALIEKGETGIVEFKSEMEKNIDFAKEIIAFANERSEKIENFLINKELLVHSRGKLHPTVAGALLFSRRPSSILGYSGITVTKFAGVEKDYNYMDYRIDLPLMNSFMENGSKRGSGLLVEALERIKLVLSDKSSASLREAKRVVEYPYPEESIREAVVNAVAHRDYTITGLDIRVDIYPDRLEIESPGRLPNTVSIESIKVGAKYYRNQVIVQYLKEAGFMDLHSLGIPVKILKLCKEYSGREPVLEELEHGFKVTLFPKLESPLKAVEKQILDVLQRSGAPLKTIEISVRIGLAKRTVLNWLNRLIDKNLVESTSTNRRDPKRKYRIKN